MGFEESLSLDVSPESQGLCVFLEVKREVSGRVPSIQFCNIFFFSMFGCRNGGLLCVKGVEWEVTFMIFLAELLLPILSTPGILTQPRVTASSKKNFPFERSFPPLYGLM